MPDVGLSPEREEKLARARLRWYRVCGISCVLTALVVIYLGVDSRADDRSGQQVRTLLVECVVPPAERKPPQSDPSAEDCYVRSKAQTAEAIGQIGDNNRTISTIAAACGAANPGDVPATEACVDRELAKD